MGDTKYDRTLHLVDRAALLRPRAGRAAAPRARHRHHAHFLSYVYLWFLPLVPLALTAWLIWSKNITYGYWFATSQSIAWTSARCPTTRCRRSAPASPTADLHRPARHPDLGADGVAVNIRHEVVLGGLEGAVQSVAGFASLHCAITLLVALMVQYTVRNRMLRIVFWVNFGLTVVATIYFGWHYIADDIAGMMIALVAFYVGGVASGQKFERHGLASHPTADSAQVPVLED